MKNDTITLELRGIVIVQPLTSLQTGKDTFIPVQTQVQLKIFTNANKSAVSYFSLTWLQPKSRTVVSNCLHVNLGVLYIITVLTL